MSDDQDYAGPAPIRLPRSIIQPVPEPVFAPPSPALPVYEEPHVPLSERARELWSERHFEKPEWSLSETLAWIAARDRIEVRDTLAFGYSPLVSDSPGLVAGTLTLNARERGWVEEEPLDALYLELMRGTVVALMDWPDRSNGRRGVAFSGADWQHLVIRAGPGGRAIVLDEKPGQDHRLHYLVNLRFDRTSVMSAFPEPSVRVTSPSP